MAQFELSLEAETRTFINTHANLLSNSAAERIQSELNRIVNFVDADEVITIFKEMSSESMIPDTNLRYLGKIYL